MRNKLIVLGLFAIFGVFLLRGGITGSVISQSCCFGDECAPEDQCPIASAATLEKPAYMSSEDSNALSLVGVLITVISILMMTGYARMRIRKDEKVLNND
ncbi:hypothetical protein KY348_02420 [Candidatus Woesearchaeota archaeon]|nr:hypothetical protein [Candidatus Woesearchaeota archaeon]